MNIVKLGTMPLLEAKDVVSICKQKGLELILDHNQETCTRGCTVTVEVSCKEVDLERVVAIFSERNAKSYEGLNIDLKQMESVFDPAAKEVTCPACGFSFSPSDLQCPDCGLGFA